MRALGRLPVASLLALLRERARCVTQVASPHLLRVQETLVDNNWAEIADHIETIEELYEVSAL